MKQYFDRNGEIITAGMTLLYEYYEHFHGEYRPVIVNRVYVTEQDEDLGIIDTFTGEFIPLSTTDMPHARINKE